jgi:LysR family glycine cleavage system transcriptional activator
MTRRLPPLNALRAFEAAARHLSITRAAEELNVTPAAVSHQVKTLEDYLGLPLFRRLTRALMLTDAAQAALPALRDGFDSLAEGAERLRAYDASGPLVVSVMPTFAAKWLVPRLDRFREVDPDIDVRIDATDRVIDFAREDADIGIRYGPGVYPGLRVDRLFSDEVFPVCSPALLDGPRPLATPADLRWHTLLHENWGVANDRWPDWRMWLRAAGVDDVDPSRGPRFSHLTMTIQAAIAGHGVALGSTVLAADDLAAGRLVRPFELRLSTPVDFAYFVVCPEAAADRPKIVAFREWLLAEAGRRPRDGTGAGPLEGTAKIA